LLSWISCDKSIGCSSSQRNRLNDLWKYSFNYAIDYPEKREGSFCRELVASQAIIQQIQSCSREDVLPSITSVLVNQQGYLLCSPISSHVEKDFPKDTLRTVLSEEKIDHFSKVIITGVRNDLTKIQGLIDFIKNETDADHLVLESKFPDSLSSYIEMIANAYAVLTVDTATAHIATALDKPTVVLLGGGHFDSFGPWFRSSKQTWVYNKLPCYGCEWFCTRDYVECIQDIQAKEIIWHLSKVLENN
jgi:ADP-heptose:LPS heptosyltransferase